jgi:hypothetical protein
MVTKHYYKQLLGVASVVYFKITAVYISRISTVVMGYTYLRKD